MAAPYPERALRNPPAGLEVTAAAEVAEVAAAEVA